jgi:hypothetical protein
MLKFQFVLLLLGYIMVLISKLSRSDAGIGVTF